MREKKESKILNFSVTTLNGMAFGLFATLIVGTIFSTIGKLFGYGSSGFSIFMNHLLSGYTKESKNILGIATIMQCLTGAGIGVGIALALKFDPLKTIVLAVVGELASFLSLSTKFVTAGVSEPAFQIGDPLTIYLVCISVALLIKLVLTKKTPVDILIIPLFGITVGTILSLGIRYPAIYVTYGVQWLVNEGTNAVPWLMGIIVAVLMGMALTAPISSAAIAAMIFIIPGSIGYADMLASAEYSGLALASGAAVVGCSTQMIGFAIQSRKDNKIGMILSIGIGTSMLQFKNILKKPIIWLPTIIVSAILGPISTCLLKTCCIGSSAGMGTAGLVGQIGTITSMGVDNWRTWVSIFGLQIVAPGVLVFLVDLLFRKLRWIKDGDLTV